MKAVIAETLRGVPWRVSAAHQDCTESSYACPDHLQPDYEAMAEAVLALFTSRGSTPKAGPVSQAEIMDMLNRLRNKLSGALSAEIPEAPQDGLGA